MAFIVNRQTFRRPTNALTTPDTRATHDLPQPKRTVATFANINAENKIVKREHRMNTMTGLD